MTGSRSEEPPGEWRLALPLRDDRSEGLLALLRGAGWEVRTASEAGAEELVVRLVPPARVRPRPQDFATVGTLPATQRLRATDVYQKLEALRRDHYPILGARLDELDRGVAALARDPSQTELAETLRSLAHRTRGTAGSYGFVVVSEALGAIESALQPGLEIDVDLLTRHVALAAEAHLRDAPPPASGESRVVHADARALLVVDSDQASLELAHDAFGSRGIEVVAAHSGREAIEAVTLEEREWLGALIDARLAKGESGFRVAQMLRSCQGLDDLAIAFTSADDSTAARVGAVHAGATLLLTKPLSDAETDELLSAFEHHRSVPTSRALLVDDDEEFAHVARTLLETEGVRTTHLPSADGIIEAIGTVRPDLVLLDVAMQPINGFDVARLIRATPPHRHLPIIFLTAHGSDSVRIECFEAGGDDYVTKPVLPAELLARVRSRLDRARLHALREDIDHLTQILSRKAFLRDARQALADASRRGETAVVALFDVDHFKSVNDRFGHETGDDVLRAIGRLLRSRLRPMDLRARWGGEEFVVLFPRTGLATAEQVIERLRAELAETEVTTSIGTTVKVRASAGVAVSSEPDMKDIEALLRTADRRLYVAKTAGRDRLVGPGSEGRGT